MQRVAELLAEAHDAPRPSATGSVVPGTIGTPAACIVSRATVFVPISSIASGGGPTQTSPASSHGAREARVLGEEAVARMHGLGPGAQTAAAMSLLRVRGSSPPRSRPERVGLVRVRGVPRGAIGVGVDGDRADPELAQRAEDADRDLAAVCDQHFRE